jgi:hypothetical protein
MVIVEPYPGDVPCAGPNAPKCDQIDDLIKLLVTIRERWGNTAIKYRLQWGANALWAEDEQKREIDKLKKQLSKMKELDVSLLRDMFDNWYMMNISMKAILMSIPTLTVEPSPEWAEMVGK